MPNDKIKIHETNDHLNITYNWFHPGGCALMFFSFLFLGIAASFLINGLSDPGEIFPLLFTGMMGLLMFFSAFSILVNKTYLNIDRKSLRVRTEPFGMFMSTHNIPLDQIVQIYVKERITKTKKSERRNYELMAKTKTSYDRSLMAMTSLESQEAMFLEERIEAFLGIRDEPVKGEYGTLAKTVAPKFIARPKSRRIDFRQMPWLNYLLQQSVNYQGVIYKVVYKTQHDWQNGESDQQVQLAQDQLNKLIFIRQEKGLFQTFLENKITLLDANKFHFNKETIPKEIVFKEKIFHLIDVKVGETFNFSNDQSIKTKQWLYQSDDQDQIRILDQNNHISYYLGNEINASELDEFSSNDSLDLNAPKKEYRIDYDEEDFV